MCDYVSEEPSANKRQEAFDSLAMFAEEGYNYAEKAGSILREVRQDLNKVSFTNEAKLDEAKIKFTDRCRNQGQRLPR